MTDYSDWKIPVEDLEEKQDEYSEVAQWCNDTGEYTIEDDGEYYKVVPIPEPPPPTYDEQKEKRARAYQEEVDPITSHIQRLRDEPEPDQQKIAELIAERDEKVLEIKERYPYPVM